MLHALVVGDVKVSGSVFSGASTQAARLLVDGISNPFAPTFFGDEFFTFTLPDQNFVMGMSTPSFTLETLNNLGNWVASDPTSVVHSSTPALSVSAPLPNSVITLGNSVKIAGDWDAASGLSVDQVAVSVSLQGKGAANPLQNLNPTVTPGAGTAFTIDLPTAGLAEDLYDLTVNLSVGGKVVQSHSLQVALSDHRVAVGDDHGKAVRSDGSLLAWGYMQYGDFNEPQQLPVDLPRVWQVAAAGRHSLALTFEGTVIAWGDNTLGQNDVPAGLNDVIQIAAGGDHSLALKRDGTLVAWGYVDTNPSTDGYSPGKIPPDINSQIIKAGAQRVVSIAAGQGYNLLILDNGKVLPLGYLSYDQDVRALTNVKAIASSVLGSVVITATNGLSAVGYQNARAVAAATKVAGDHRGAILGLATSGSLFSWTPSGSFAPSYPNLKGAMQLGLGVSTAAVLQADGTLTDWNPYGAVDSWSPGAYSVNIDHWTPCSADSTIPRSAKDGLPASLISGCRIAASTQLSNLPDLTYLVVGQLVDSITSDAPPYNGFASNATQGAISFRFDQDYALDSFILWNDINVGTEGVSNFRLDFRDVAGQLIGSSDYYQPTLGLRLPTVFKFPPIEKVRSVDLVIVQSSSRIEICEVAFGGLLTLPPNLTASGVQAASLGL